MDPSRWTENLQLKADRDSSVGERSLLQGGKTSIELLQLEAEISPLKGKRRRAEEAREKQGEEGTQAEPRNGKRLMKMQTLSDQRGSPTWKWRYRGILDSQASSSLLCSGRLLRPRSIEMDGIIEGSPRQE